MANTIDQSKQLPATYLPHNATLVRRADRARTRGRSRLRACEPKAGQKVVEVQRSAVRVEAQSEVSK